jgi:hypothetical protein
MPEEKNAAGFIAKGTGSPAPALEPWMRGTHANLDPVLRAVIHGLELAEEDVARWCDGLNDAEMFARPCGVAPVAFHLRHIARSLDRLLTYAENRVLSEAHLGALRTEMSVEGSAADVLAEFHEALRIAKQRMVMFAPESVAEPRGIGRELLPTTVAGLLIHCAEHTSRHVGQVVTTAKIVRAGI